jgi:DUF971 family protein
VDERFEPRLIDVAQDEGVTITYHDGHVARFEIERLRKSCPCAQCRSLRDQGDQAWPRPGSPVPLRIEDVHRHGAWGIVITWNDRHDTGIFPFMALRQWDDGGDAFAPDSGLGGSGS